MKKLFVVVAVAVFVAFAATSAMALIAGSAHDLSSTGPDTGGTLSSCQYCHTPHHAVTTTAAPENAAPLWNRTVQAGYTPENGAGSYTVYGATAAGAPGVTLSSTQVNAPGTHSKTCLSCHDGTVAVSSVVNFASLSATITAGPGLNASGLLTDNTSTDLTTNLTDDHPIGVVYGATAGAINKAGLAPAASWNVAANNGQATLAGGWMIYGGGVGTGLVECGSCHDPHNTNTGQSPFLKGNLSTICSDCHSTK